MKKITIPQLLTIAVAVALVCTGTSAGSASSRDDYSMSGEGSMHKAKFSHGERSLTQVEGEIIGTKSVNVRGADKQHQVLRIRTDRDNIVLADLGPKTQSLRKLNLSEGKRVTITGRSGEAGEKAIILADRIQSGGQTVNVKMPQMKRVQGQVVAAQDVAVRRTGDTNRVVILQTDKGKLPVDQGSRDRLKNVKIEEGTTLKAEGKIVQVQGKPFLMASMFKAENMHPKTIDRSKEKRFK